jgi:transposase
MKPLNVTPTQQKLLTTIVHRARSEQRLIKRARILLEYQESGSQVKVAAAEQVDRNTVAHWLKRWNQARASLDFWEEEYEQKRITRKAYERELEKLIGDEPRSGTRPTFTEAEKQQILAVAARPPEEEGVPVTHWTHQLLAQVVIRKKIVPRISASQVGRFLKEGHASTSSKPLLGTSQR